MTENAQIDKIPRQRLDKLSRALIDGWQRDFPLSSRPFAEIAAALDVGEDDVLEALGQLSEAGTLSRIGAVVAPNTAGVSTLCAMAVPAARLEEVAAVVNGYDEVNHNYEREHALSLWFVVTAADEARLEAVLAEIADRTGLEVLDLPLLEAFHIDLGFPVQWS